MADMSREKAISLTKRVKEVHVDRYCAKSFSDALEFAIADMQRVEKLEMENELLREKIFNELHVDHEIIEAKLKKENAELKNGIEELETEVEALKIDLWFNQNGYQVIDTKYKRLKDCLEKIKNTCLVSPSVIFPSDILDTINEYLGE